MTIFGDFRLGRVGYLVAITLMLAFDLFKGPVQQFLVMQHDVAAEALLAPRPVTDAATIEPSRIHGREMPFLLKAHEDIVRDMAQPGRKESGEKRPSAMGLPFAELPDMEANSPVSPEITKLDEKRSLLAAAFPIAVLIMTAVTIVTLLWMVSSRLRDIGWPQYLTWLLIAPIFVPKFLALPLSPVAAQVAGLVFYTGVAFLALIPGEAQRMSDPPPPPATPQNPVVVRRGPARFGRLGRQ